MRVSYAVLVLAWVGAWGLPAARAKEKEPAVPSAEDPAEVKKGRTALLTAPKGMKYFLHVPKKYDAKEGAPLLVWLHGSNMNGMQYLPMFGARRWYDHAILVAPNGETGGDPFGANNFTQQSAPLVADVTEQVQKAFHVTHTYVGGHSQGGFLTYSVIMHFPDLYQGALPMAGDCWMQNEPNLWEEQPEILAKQMAIPIAIIHGRADPVVDFRQGRHAYDVFRVMGYPKLRLFAPETLGHQFGLSPVGEALEWLDAMRGLEPKDGLKAAARWAKEGEWGWAFQAASAYLRDEGLGASDRAKAQKLVEGAEGAAARAAEALRPVLAASAEPKAWLEPFWEFRRVFGSTEAARPLVEDHLARRAEQRAVGRRMWNEAFGHSRAGQMPQCHEALERLLREAPYAFEACYALGWLAERDGSAGR